MDHRKFSEQKPYMNIIRKSCKADERIFSIIFTNALTKDIKMQTQIINNGCNTFDRR